MVADVVPDKSLYKVLDNDAKRPDSIAAAGDSPAGALGRWLFEGTLAADQSKAALVIANGTAPGERGENAAAGALAKGWDKLKMWATPVESKTFGGGACRILVGQRVPAGEGQRRRAHDGRRIAKRKAEVSRHAERSG